MFLPSKKYSENLDAVAHFFFDPRRTNDIKLRNLAPFTVLEFVKMSIYRYDLDRYKIAQAV